MPTCIWAFQPLAELNNATGFVECDDELAVQLIANGKAQDPQIGGTLLNQITDKPLEPAPAMSQIPATRVAQTYDDKQMIPKRRGK